MSTNPSGIPRSVIYAARLLVYAGRFLGGRPMTGKRHTDSTFTRRASRDLTVHKRSAHWHWRAGWERAAIRVGTAALALVTCYGLLTARTATVAAMLAASGCAIIAGGFLARLRVVNWNLDRKIGRPLFMTAAAITGHDHTDNHRSHLSIPRDHKTNPKAVITFKLPYHWEGLPQECKRVEQLFARRLGGEWDATWHFNSYPPHVKFIPSPAPPGSVSFADILPALEKSNGNRVILGIGTHAATASVDLDSESPHIAITAGTGGGKSAQLRLIIAQLIRHGVRRIDIIDPKRISHAWARHIPGVYIHTSMSEQMKAIHAFRTEMESRYDAMESESIAGRKAPEFDRHVLIIEEQNSFINYARQWWKDYRNELTSAERSRIPAETPVIGDLAFILFQGRQSRMNVISVFQRLSASAAGGGDLRENYGCKILARFSPQTWKLLVGTSPVPRSSRINGRAKFVLGEDAKDIQMGYLREKTARDWPGIPESQWMDEAYDYAMRGAALFAESIDDGPEPDSPLSLREASDAKVIPLSYGALRRARNRNPARFPAAVESGSYRPSDLRAWYESRPSARSRMRAA